MATEVWRWQGGTAARDELRGASIGVDGACTLVGYTFGDWSGASAGARDWTAVRLDAEGVLQGKWQDGTEGVEQMNAVTLGEDGSVVMVGNAGEGTQSLSAVKLDAEGELLWAWQDGSSAGDVAHAVSMAEDGSVTLAGSTFGLWGETHAGSSDFIASKLDSEGTLMWTWQNGTTEQEEIFAEVVGDDGLVVLAGHTYGNWTYGAHGGDEDADYAAVKLDADGYELWRWQDGTSATDTFYGAAGGQDGSVVLAGVTEGSWQGAHAGGANDFAAVKLDADGGEIWRWQDGTAEDDILKGVASGQDGSVVLAGHTKGAWASPSDGSYDFAAVKLDANGIEVWRWQGGSDNSAADYLEAVAAGPNESVVLAGWTSGSWDDENAGVYDFAALMLRTETSLTPSPTAEPHLSIDALPSTQTPTGFSATPKPTDRPSSLAPADAVRTSRPPASPSLSSPAPTSMGLNPVSASTPGPAPIAPAPTVVPTLPTMMSTVPTSREPTSPAPTTSGRSTFDTPPSLAPMLVESGSGASISSILFGLSSIVVTLATVSAVMCLCRRHKAKKDDDEHEEDREVSDTTAAPPDEVVTDASVTTAARPYGVVEVSNGSTPSQDNSLLYSQSGRCDVDVVDAVMEIASNLAQQSHFPGVSEAATLVSTMVNLISHDRGSVAETESMLKRCRFLVMTLERAAMVLGKIDIVEDNDSSREMKRMLMKNVEDAIADMVGLIKTYRSKRRITQVVVSTLFKRRMAETEVVINLALTDLMRWLEINAALNREGGRGHTSKHRRPSGPARRERRSSKDPATEWPHLPLPVAKAESATSARSLRRQCNLDQIEIPEDHVLISKDILGKGGFGTVYIADYNGRKAAAKVIEIDRDLGEHCDHRGNETKEGAKREQKMSDRQRESLLMELQAMIRIRSPHTVNVYGAMTGREDRVVLVMELLTGGNLQSMLKHSEEVLPESQARRLIADVCVGMAFLHSRGTVHGDVKSANVLLDGEGRAKIGDFGTSRWAQHRDETGLATYKHTQGISTMLMMSFAWAAPEVLDVKGSSYASDVYSFGIVAWEVLSMQVPWAEEASPLDIYKRVVFKGERPTIPADAPPDIADIVRTCWAGVPEERPSASAVIAKLRSSDVQV